MQNTIIKSKKTTQKITNSKRIILDYSKNPSFDYKITALHDYYGGLSKVEITKLAIIEFFKNHIGISKIHLTDEEEESLEQSMNSGNQKFQRENHESSKEFLERLVADKNL